MDSREARRNDIDEEIVGVERHDYWSICPDDSRKRARALRVRRRSEQAAKKAYSGYGLVSESILLSLRATSPIKAAQMITKTRMIEPATTTGLFILEASMAKVSIAAKL